MNEYNNEQSALKTACVRLARHGLQLVNTGNVDSGVAYVKIAHALAEGYALDDILNSAFPPQIRTKVAAEMELVIGLPSQVAIETVKQAAAIQKQAQQAQQAQTQKQAFGSAGTNALIGGSLGAALAGGSALAFGDEKKKRKALMYSLLGGGLGAAGGYALGSPQIARLLSGGASPKPAGSALGTVGKGTALAAGLLGAGYVGHRHGDQIVDTAKNVGGKVRDFASNTAARISNGVMGKPAAEPAAKPAAEPAAKKANAQSSSILGEYFIP